MSASRRPWRHATRLVVASLAAFATVGATQPAPSTTLSADPGDWHGIQGEGSGRVDSVDRRTGRIAPNAGQEALARQLGATAARWNRFGTPHVLVRHGGHLSGPREGDAVDVARSWVRAHRDLFRMSAAQVDALEVVRDTALHDAPDQVRVGRQRLAPRNSDVAHVVLFRQAFGDLPTGWDGLLTVGVSAAGEITWVSSSVTGDGELRGDVRLDAVDAIRAAADDAGLDVGDLEPADVPGRWTTFRSLRLGDVQRVREVAFPTVERGVRRAYEIVLLKASHDELGHPEAYISFVDAEDGTVWRRENAVDHLAEEGAEDAVATWRVFEANPPFVVGAGAVEDPSVDTRVLWCWGAAGEGCDEDVANIAARLPWDVNPPSLASHTTDGNNATTAISHVSPFTPDTAYDRPFSASRDYDFAWDNTWFESACDPSTFATDNDDSAATANLFVMHNRMHDWSYFLGFTEVTHNLQKSNFGNTSPDFENDPEVGDAQAGRLTVLGRDNANQITLPDGIPPITNQYLWEPLAGAFYAPCVDGAYDMAIVAHEYMHAITNRMIAGPDTGTGSSQGQTESWSDLAFAEYFRGFGIVASPDANPFALAPYVTGDGEAGVRNYGMNRSPLNYSDIGYDGNGLTSPHANGEIWSATNFDISVLLNEKYDGEFPSTDPVLQRRCAEGELPADHCPGNRRWVQILFDSFLLNPHDSTMVNSRDAMLAADVLRFDGDNQLELWEGFAARGFGETAASAPLDDPDDAHEDPTPGWSNPLRDDNATVTFELVDETGAPVAGEVYVGVYEARVTPTADTHPDDPQADTPDEGSSEGGSEESEEGEAEAPLPPIDATEEFVPGTYDLLVRADGFGGTRLTETFAAGETRTVTVTLQRNLASLHNGASIAGDGGNLEELIDDTEGTNWASLTSEGTASEGKGEGAQVEGRQVTVELADGPQPIGELRMSAALRGRDSDDEDDPGSQSRFSALRSFDVYACNAEVADCTDDGAFALVFKSPDDAFPGHRPRPRSPDFTLRSFDIDDVVATHLRLVVRDNQCTGGPDFQGDVNPVSDPVFSNPDCDSEAGSLGRAILNPPEDQVRAAELQVFAPATAGDGDEPAPGRGQGDERRRGRGPTER